MTLDRAQIRTRRRLLAGGLAAAVVAATGLPAQALGRRGGAFGAGLSAEGLGIARAGATGQTLTEISGDGSLIPGLAEAWEPIQGGRVWSLTLRNPMPGAADILRAFGEVETVGRHVRVTMPDADANLPLRLAAPDLAVPGEMGLYRVVSDDGVTLELARNADHWKEDRAGWADTVTLTQIDSPAARLAALRQGRVDVIDGLDDHARRMLSSRDDVTILGDIAVSDRVGLPTAIGSLWPLDNGRMAERWWLG